MLGLLANDWQISGVHRWMSGTPYPIAYSIPGIGNANLTGSDLAYDASGSVVRNNGFGSITGVRPPRTLQLITRLTF